MEVYVEFNTAKIAKEKGFNWNSNRYYQDSERAGIFEINKPINNQLIEAVHLIDKYCVIYSVAPTQAVLQRWLRDIKRLHVESHMYIEDGIYKYKFLIKSDFEYELIILKEENNFTTSEKALEAGLVEALINFQNYK